ncbi:hypothetical protein KM043_017130 [Ampulex compressa]|nr:hypothetical protein KM043_017130 [Ampulex compressa]
MAAGLRGLLMLNINLSNRTLFKNAFINGCRYMYTERSLNMPGYEQSRVHFSKQFMNVEKVFRDKMVEVCNDKNGMIFTEDLKAMTHLLRKEERDIELLEKMLLKFNSQNKELRFGTFIFGPVVMRAFYYLDEPDIALKLFKNPELNTFFDQHAAFQILLTLLYKHERYTDMRSVFDVIKLKHISGIGHPKSTALLVMAACYKENTPESFEYALNLWRDMTEKGQEMLRRVLILLSALALKQKAAHIAIEILTGVKDQRFIETKCLKILSFLELERYAEIIPILRTLVQFDRPPMRKDRMFKDVIQQIEQKLDTINNDISAEIIKLIGFIKTNDLLMDTTLEEHIQTPVDQVRGINQSSIRKHQVFDNQRQQYLERTRGSGMRDLL